jgi:hypothetical protein
VRAELLNHARRISRSAQCQKRSHSQYGGLGLERPTFQPSIDIELSKGPPWIAAFERLSSHIEQEDLL